MNMNSIKQSLVFASVNEQEENKALPVHSLLSGLIELGKELYENYDVMQTAKQAFDAITNESVGVKQLIEFSGNSELDKKHLRAIALTSLYENMEKDPSLLNFHRSFLALALVKLMVTDFLREQA
jgi:hypothetical protein